MLVAEGTLIHRGMKRGIQRSHCTLWVETHTGTQAAADTDTEDV